MSADPFISQQLENREMRTADLHQVLAIERNAQIMPWSRLSFEESLNKQHRCRVIECNGEILAFHIVCPVLDELHVLNLAVAKQHQGRGLGHALMHDITSLAEANQLTRIFLEVRYTNTAAVSLYQKWQFTQIGVRKGYYRTKGEQREDALVYVRIAA